MSAIDAILKQYWGYDTFRPLQETIIESVLSGKDTLALLPTGGGKSICFQVPALAMDGLCVVISPLIALMKDQVENLKKRGIEAVAIHSGMSRRLVDITLDNCRFGNIKFLYVSPERIQTELFMARFKEMNVNLLAIDEAHCISQWGYDFRPQYLQIAALRELKPSVPMIALTATATQEVRTDIVEKLQFRQPQVFTGSFARANLSYSVFELEDKERKMLEILQKVPGSAVVYVHSRKRTRDISDWLNQQGIRADYYHAGLSHEERNLKQEEWIRGRKRVIVATNAFGMGIDKADVRTVIHIDVPDTLENYYQEAGRAGRDEKKAYAIALYHASDLEQMQYALEQTYPSMEKLRQVYQALANYYQIAAGGGYLAAYDFDLELFCQTYRFAVQETYYALKRLEDEGFIQLTEAFHQPSRILFQADKKELYAFQVANAPYDPLIKTILRIHGGDIFGNFVAISENKLAEYLRIDIPVLTQMLTYLHQVQILVYEPQKNKPQLIFTTVRHEASRLPLDVPQLEWRKQRDLTKLAALMRYMSEKRRCRTLQLLDYFDEKSQNDCGVCDICVQKRKSHQNLDLIEGYRTKIRLLLKQQPQQWQELIQQVSTTDTVRVVEILRQMADVGEIVLEEDGLVRRQKAGI